jgi:hypothetical protein
MATLIFDCGGRPKCRARQRSALSLIELLVVLFIIGVMLGLLLPALSGARARMQGTVCQNNIRQLEMGLRGYTNSAKKLPVLHRWPVDLLKWTEEWALAEEMKGNFDPNAEFPRPPLMRCPMQEDFPSRVATVGFSHYVLTIDRPERPVTRNQFKGFSPNIHDRERLSEEKPQEPWYIGPELTPFGQQKLFATEPGPHPSDLYMTRFGLMP